jgi:hypothetical protein
LTDFILQITVGSLCLLLSALIHVAIFAVGIPKIVVLSNVTQSLRLFLRNVLLLSAGVGLLIVAHTITIWFWAIAFFASGTFFDFASSFYFSTVTYTTLGYGDIVLDPSMRIFGSFAAITGLLTFGISTAFLVGFLVRILPDAFRQH